MRLERATSSTTSESTTLSTSSLDSRKIPSTASIFLFEYLYEVRDSGGLVLTLSLLLIGSDVEGIREVLEHHRSLLSCSDDRLAPSALHSR